MYTIGIDLGGTNIAAGVVDRDYRIIGRAVIKTNLPRPQEEIVKDLAEAARRAAADAGVGMDEIESIGVGSPGTVDGSHGVVEYSNNIRFRRCDIRSAIGEMLGKECDVANDANAAALGELVAGAGKNVDHFVAITLGTGVGSGVIVNGTLLTGFNWAGAELGHMVIMGGGETCTCGLRGCFEAYASATALIRDTRSAMELNPASAMWELCGGDSAAASGRTAFDAMRLGDIAAKSVVDTYIRHLAAGVINIINIFQPEVLCIGGGVSNEKDEYLLEPLRSIVSVSTYACEQVRPTTILRASLGNDAGIIGAAALRRFAAR